MHVENADPTIHRMSKLKKNYTFNHDPIYVTSINLFTDKILISPRSLAIKYQIVHKILIQ